MAAWLAYLKSRLLLPEGEADRPSAEDMANALAWLSAPGGVRRFPPA